MGRLEMSVVASGRLNLEAHRAAVAGPDAGAIATFEGAVRRHDPASPSLVIALEYQAHPSAQEVLTALANQVAVREDITAVAVSHRVDDRLEIGDVALVCAVSAPHRGAAFEACSDLVERIKHELPVWKLQQFEDGTEEWVNCP